jgi:uncharacterized protein YkwD
MARHGYNDPRRRWVKKPRHAALATGGAVLAVFAVFGIFAVSPGTNIASDVHVLGTEVSAPSSATSTIQDPVEITPPSSSMANSVPASTSPNATPTTTHPIPKAAAAQPKAKAPAHTPAPAKTTAKPSGVTEDSSIATAVFNLLNSERAQNHLAALKWSSQLVSSAHAHNLKMVSANDFSHQVPGEAGLGPRISATGLSWTWVGENIAWSSVTSTSAADSLQASMYNEKPPDDGHRQNILTTSGTMVGIDVVTDKSGKMWITEDFGN